MQRLFVASTIVALWRTAARLFDERVGLAAMVTAIVVVYEKFAPWSGILLSETLFVPLVCLWMYALVRFAECPTRGRAIAAGSVGALATLTRSSLLLGWAAVVPALAIALGWRRQRLGRQALLVATMIAITSTATIRNWIVARQFVAIASEGAVVLFVGNSPPPLTIPPSHKVQYRATWPRPHGAGRRGVRQTATTHLRAWTVAEGAIHPGLVRRDATGGWHVGFLYRHVDDDARGHRAPAAGSRAGDRYAWR